MSTFKQYQPLAYCPDGTYLPFDGPKDTLEEAWESIDSALGKNGLPLSRTKYVVLTIWPDARVSQQSKQDNWLYYADSESQKTNMSEVVPPMSDNGKPQDPEVKWEPVVKVFSQGIRGSGEAIPYAVDTWRRARRVSCPHCGTQHFYRAIENGDKELSPEGNTHCVSCLKLFYWPLANNDELVQGKLVDTPSTHYETYKQEDLGEWKEPSLDNTSDVHIQACRHMREAEWALKRIGIGIIPSWPDLAVRCYQCNITINAEGPIGQVNRL